MSEYTIGWLSSLSGLGLLLSSTLYWLGGRRDKYLRRFLGSFVLAATVNLISLFMGHWTPWLIAIWPLITIGYHMGYGGDELMVKIKRRFIYASMVVVCGVLYCAFVSTSCVWVFIPHFLIAMFSVYLGIKNPIYAAAEEFFVSMMLNLGLIMYPFVVGL